MSEELELQSQGFFKKNGIELECDFSVSSLGFFEDRYLVQNSLLNLLKNAAENSYENGTVLFKSYCKNNNLVFIVENLNGPHFNPEKVTTRVEGGRQRGLGLNIIKSNIEQLGGTFCPVKASGGMRMEITIPVNLVKASKILLVDDDENFSDAATLWFEHLGFEIDSMDHDDELASHEEYGFAVVDIQSGKGFAYVLKHKIPKEKVIFISGSEVMLEKAKRRGFRTALKGCSLNHLMEQINRVA